MARRTIFNNEHDLYRRVTREFIENEITPHHEQWEHDGVVSRESWLAAGAGGHLCHSVPEQYGGAGVDDFRFSAILIEELANGLASGPGFYIHSEMVVPYIQANGSEEQKKRWLPGCVDGSLITAVAMTEPGTGSDLAGIKTRAGFHFIKMETKILGDKLTFEEAQQQIRKDLAQQRRLLQAKNFEEQLLKKADVKIYLDD